MESTTYSAGVVEQLLEANQTLQSEVQRLTDQRRILRRVNSALREALESQRRQVAIAVENDEQFKSLCQEGQESFDGTVSEEASGGLPSASYKVEPLG
jgi:hypothetical protein